MKIKVPKRIRTDKLERIIRFGHYLEKGLIFERREIGNIRVYKMNSSVIATYSNNGHLIEYYGENG